MSTLSVQSEVRRYRFDSADGLFRDAHGRRVIADAEGTGEWKVEVAEPPLLVLRGEERTDAFRGTFKESLSVLALGPGLVQVAVVVGPSPRLSGARTFASSSFEGSGWVVSSDGPLVIDDRREAAASPTPELPIPFLHSAKAERLEVVPAGFYLDRIDSFAIDDLDALKGRGWRVQNMSRVTTLASRFSDGSPHVAPVASHLNAATWTCAIPSDNLGLRLRKTYDRFHGLQRARVFVDGVFAGWWYEPTQNRDVRWAVSDFGINPALTVGKTSATLTIDPPAGSPLWSVSQIEIWALSRKHSDAG